MLYGMDEDHEYIAEEYGLVKQEKLNIKKVIACISIVLICLLLVFGNIYISLNNLNDDKEKNLIAIQENKVEENNIENKNLENKDLDENLNKNTSQDIKTIIDKDKNGYYIGKHIRLGIHDTEEIKKKFVPQFNLDGQQMIKDIYLSEEKQVYLTFDDGPSKDITPQILDILKENDVKATFFVLGARVDLYPETTKRIFEEGHYLANHGYSHKYADIYRNKDTVFEEYIWCENSIKAALNNPDYNCYLFRFPGGSSGGRYSRIKAEAREHLNSYAVAYTNWNCLTGDAEGKNTKEECIQELIRTKGNQNSLIVLMHDSNDKVQTLESLPEIIQYFKNEGYTFKNFYEIF